MHGAGAASVTGVSPEAGGGAHMLAPHLLPGYPPRQVAGPTACCACASAGLSAPAVEMSSFMLVVWMLKASVSKLGFASHVPMQARASAPTYVALVRLERPPWHGVRVRA